MDRVIAEAGTVCPTNNVTDWIRFVYNVSIFSDIQLITLACQYADALTTMDQLGFWNGLAYVFGFAFGIPSAILAILTFYRSEFDTVSFFYHRVINIIELLYMGFIAENAIGWMTGDLMSTSWFWSQFLTYFHYKLDLALPLAIQLIILWVAIERVTICFASAWFARVNRKPVAYAVIIFSLIVSISAYMPVAFTTKFVYNNVTQRYRRTPTDFAMSSGFRMYIYFLALLSFTQFALMIAATGATIAGLIQISRRKRRLIESSGGKSANAHQLLHQINVNRQLCLLQLCESVPVVVNCFLLVWMQCFSYGMDPTALVTKPYDEATNNIHLFRRYLYLGYLQTLVDLAEHSTHFYRYYVFSKKVKTTLHGIFKKNVVSQVSIFVT